MSTGNFDHCLDEYIEDIEDRLLAIFKSSAANAEGSLQTSLASYGWILLDSWVAWRTLRYLLRDMPIEQAIQKKWFQTPSSYNASQLKAVWRFGDKVIDYANNRGGDFRGIFDTIQNKRNAAAHYSRKAIIQGADISNNIKKNFELLSDVFLFCEIAGFIDDFIDDLSRKGYKEFNIEFLVANNNERITIKASEFREHIKDFVDAKGEKEVDVFLLSFKKGCEYNIKFSKDGCWNEANNGQGTTVRKQIMRSDTERSEYNFFKNKGYYTSVKLFTEAWEKMVVS